MRRMSPVILAAWIVFLEGLVLWAVFPTLAAYCAALGSEQQGVIGLMFALMAAPKVIGNPLLGVASDRIGRRPVLIGCTLGMLGSSILWALAPGLVVLGISRLVAGIFGAQASQASAVVADVTKPEQRSRGMALIGAGFALSIILGPPLGGIVSQVYGPAAVGWLCAAIQLVSLVSIIALLPETHRRQNSNPRADASATNARTAKSTISANALTAYVVTFLSGAALSLLGPTLAAVFDKHFALDEFAAGLAFTGIGLVGALAQGGLVRSLSKRVSDTRIAASGLFITAIGFVALAYALFGAIAGESGADGAVRASLLGYSVGLVIVTIGTALSTPTVSAIVSNASAADQQGRALGIQQGVGALGRAASAGLGGVLIAHFGYAAGYAAGALLAVIALLVLARFREVQVAPKPPAANQPAS